MRARWLYRSAHFGDATSRDLLGLIELGLESVIDLRGPGERLRAPSPAHPNFMARILHADLETGALAPHIEVAVKGVRTVQEARVATQLVFADMPCRPVIIAVLNTYFTALAETDGPSRSHLREAGGVT